MNIKAFLKKFDHQKPILLEWATYIIDEINNELLKEKNDFNPEYYYKIPPTPRIKQNDSLALKALQPKYNDPFNEITDKIGCRFVLLTNSDVIKICSIIQNSTKWDFSLDRDYEQEKRANPLLFDYQSMHFILFPKKKIKLKNHYVNKSIKCEIQVRTLLQHAYAELSHFTVYKPKLKEKNKNKYERILSRSVALIETVDDNFNNIMNTFTKDFKAQEHWLNITIKAFSQIHSPHNYNKNFNEEFIDSFSSTLSNYTTEEFTNFLDNNKNIFLKIKRRIHRPVYNQPIILLVYFLISNLGYYSFDKKFNRPTYLVEDAFADLGISMDTNVLN